MVKNRFVETLPFVPLHDEQRRFVARFRTVARGPVRRHTTRTNAVTDVKIYSNAKEVELLLNGATQGRHTNDGHAVFVWKNLQLNPGENTVAAKAECKGTQLSRVHAEETGWHRRLACPERRLAARNRGGWNTPNGFLPPLPSGGRVARRDGPVARPTHRPTASFRLRVLRQDILRRVAGLQLIKFSTTRWIPSW